MKTRTKKVSAPRIAPREPTDAELRALDESHAEALEMEAAEAQARSVATFAVGSTPIDLARLGLNQIAYVRRSIVDDQPIWSIHSASGHPLGAAPTFEQAWGAVVQNELVPMYVN